MSHPTALPPADAGRSVLAARVGRVEALDDCGTPPPLERMEGAATAAGFMGVAGSGRAGAGAGGKVGVRLLVGRLLGPGSKDGTDGIDIAGGANGAAVANSAGGADWTGGAGGAGAGGFVRGSIVGAALAGRRIAVAAPRRRGAVAAAAAVATCSSRCIRCTSAALMERGIALVGPSLSSERALAIAVRIQPAPVSRLLSVPERGRGITAD